MTDRDRTLADRALAAQYGFADIREGNPWWGQVATKMANMEGMAEKATFFETVRIIARNATTYAVSTDFTEMVQQAAEDLMFQWMEGDEQPEVLLPYDVPAPIGFVHFAHHIRLPLVSPDENGEDSNMGSIGFMWIQGLQVDETPGAIAFVPFTARDFWQDRLIDYRQAVKSYGQMPEYLAHDYAGWHFGRQWRVDPTSPLGELAKTVVEDGREIRLFNPSAAADRAILWSFFRLVSQRIPRVERMRPSRATKRRVTAKPDLMVSLPEDGAINYVTLRKETAPEHERLEGESETNWTHRWVCSPGWVRRRVATRDVEGNIIGSTRGVEGKDWTYRRVYIKPFIKGPESKPLILKDTVNILKR